MKKLRVGLVGCGGMGMNVGRKCHSLDEAEITAVCDIDPEALAKAGDEFGAARFRTYHRLLASDIDAVMVATPNDSHAPITIKAAGLGKHVYCEKPMAMRVSDCKAMIAACDAAGVKLMVGQVLRLIKPFWRSRQIVTSGEIGDPFAMNVTRISAPGSLSKGWRATMKQCGGVLPEVHVHELDFMRHVLGEAKSVYASTCRFADFGGEYEDTAFVHIRYANGGIGTLHCGTSSSIGKYEMMIQCTKGTLVNAGFGGPIRYSLFGGERTEIALDSFDKEDAYHEEVRSWIEAITKGTPMIFDGHDGMKAIEIVEAAYKSARTGKAVNLA